MTPYDDKLELVITDLKSAKSDIAHWAETWGRKMGFRGLNSTSATDVDKDGEPKTVFSGAEDELDAFRHTFTAACAVAWPSINGLRGSFSQDEWIMLIRIIGLANEIPFPMTDRPTTAPCARYMDLHNNEMGFEIAPDASSMLDWLRDGENPSLHIAYAVAQAIFDGKVITSYLDSRMPKECRTLDKKRGKGFIWRTQNDDKVRFDHAVKHGKFFTWGELAPDELPGAAFGCRCVAEPVEE